MTKGRVQAGRQKERLPETGFLRKLASFHFQEVRHVRQI
jgi:hypothetical protein